MSVKAECKVCEETFNCTNRKPLVLPCGHTYCLACLTGIETSGDKLCPACREAWGCLAYKLPISYMLIPKNAEQNNPKDGLPNYDECCLHSSSLEYWCCKCQVATCKKCISENHYAHGTIAFESLFEDAEHVDDIKVQFATKIAPKLLADVNASAEICSEGLKITELMTEAEKTFISCKKYLVVQQKCMKNFVEFENESSASVKEKLEVLAKVMTRCDIQHSLLTQKMEVACTKLSTLNAGIKQMHENLRDTKRALLFKELNWTIEGEKNALKILNVLGTSDVQPPPSVTVVSSHNNPINSLSELLIALTGRGCTIRLLLLDSLYSGVQFLDDFCRLEPVIGAGVGENLAAFYGYIGQSSNWFKLGTSKLCELGLRLDSGAAVAELNAIVAKSFEKIVQGTIRPVGAKLASTRGLGWANGKQVAEVGKMDVVVSKAIVPADIYAGIRMTPNVSLCLYILELQDKEVSWCAEILPKLIPPPKQNSCEVWLPRCELSKSSLEELIIVVKKTRAKSLRLQAPDLSEAEKNQVYNFGRQHGIAVTNTVSKE